MVSALILGLISVATFTGLQAVNATNANQRFHNEAALLAAQSQESLRSDPIGSIEKLVSSPNVYTPKVDGTAYTVTQSAHELNGSGLSTSCTATEHTTNTAPNFEVITSVTWHGLEGGHPLKESSIVTPPTGSSVEVDVDNAPTPTAGVSGVTAAVTYTAEESGSTVKLEGTTGTAGCVLFTGIRATSAIVEVQQKTNFVTPSGALKVTPASSEVSIAPGLTTHYAVTYNEGGAITAKFTYNGQPEHNGKTVTGDTFVVSNTEMELSPELEVGSTLFEPFETGGEEHYTAKTSSYQPTGTTAKGSKYSRGDLFPFPSNKWSVYPGDCAANNPLTVTSKVVAPGEGIVTPGATTTISAPTSYVNLEVYKGTEKNPSTLASAIYKVKITNLSCSTATPTLPLPDNAAAVSYVHTQNTTTGGVLEAPFQPFGKFELCLQAVTNTRKDKISYLNNTVAGSAFKIYPEEPTTAEKTATRETEEAPAKEKRETEESTQATQKAKEESKWNTRVSEEAAINNAQSAEEAANVATETTEANERATWESDEKAKTTPPKISHTERVNKETTQTTARNTRHSNEATKKSTRQSELSTLHTRKTAEEATKTTREKAETTTKENKTKEEATRTARIKVENEEATEKAEHVAKGTAAAVESGPC